MTILSELRCALMNIEGGVRRKAETTIAIGIAQLRAQITALEAGKSLGDKSTSVFEEIEEVACKDEPDR